MGPTTSATPGTSLATSLMLLAVFAAVLAGTVSIQFSIATVFLFAGPHNWMEARYIISRLPARAGRLWPFFLLSLAGVIGLTLAFALLPILGRKLGGSRNDYEFLSALWGSIFVLWAAALVQLRSQSVPRRDWGWVWSAAFGLIALVWVAPLLFGISLVYLHPLMALWILDRELVKTRPDWRLAYHRCLQTIPICCLVLFLILKDAPPLPGTDALTLAIANHAGDWLFTGVSAHFLVALHAFLEMVHYGIWILIIPIIGLRSMPWEIQQIPVARRSITGRRLIACILIAGLVIVGVLWTCFLVDYEITRSIYFSVAMLHVLAEIPFVLRML